jgi:hypothetical protein
MNKPAMMDWALRLLRLLNERKVLNSRIVAEEFDVNIRTAQRYLLYLSDLPCVVVDEEKHTYTLTSDYIIGSRFERHNVKSTEGWELFENNGKCRFTDDTVLTVATAEVLLEGLDYAQMSSGGRFRWAATAIPSPVLPARSPRRALVVYQNASRPRPCRDLPFPSER